MQSWGLTDPGCVRVQNQDTFAMEQLDRNTLLCIVCDGMGGAKSGNIASSLAVDVFVQEIRRTWTPLMNQEKINQMLHSAAKLANFTVFDQAQQFEEFDGMGTTLVAILLHNRHATVAHVGDSRAYRINDQGIWQLTRDHSLVQMMVERGELTQEMARTYPGKNFITRAIGTEPIVVCDVSHLELAKGECLLLCSDGLTNHIGSDELAFIITSDAEVSLKADTLVSRANSYGGTDNITAVVIKLENC